MLKGLPVLQVLLARKACRANKALKAFKANPEHRDLQVRPDHPERRAFRELQVILVQLDHPDRRDLLVPQVQLEAATLLSTRPGYHATSSSPEVLLRATAPLGRPSITISKAGLRRLVNSR